MITNTAKQSNRRRRPTARSLDELDKLVPKQPQDPKARMVLRETADGGYTHKAEVQGDHLHIHITAPSIAVEDVLAKPVPPVQPQVKEVIMTTTPPPTEPTNASATEANPHQEAIDELTRQNSVFAEHLGRQNKRIHALRLQRNIALTAVIATGVAVAYVHYRAGGTQAIEA